MGLLDGKTGLVFGIANDKSYAWHIANAILAEGGTCAFTHLPGEKNERRTRKALAELGIERPWLAPCDVSSDEDLDRVFDAYGESFERHDFVVHSVAFANKDFLQPGQFVHTPRNDFRQALDISVYSFIAVANRAAELMEEGGSMITLSYFGAEKAVPGYNVMGVAKAALEASTRYLALELGEEDIRVNAISGGPLRTMSALGVGGFGKILRHAPHKAPLRRNIDGEEVGSTAAFLLSDYASAITGEVLYVDAGYNIVGL